ncbi:peptidyl-prolyl cis-trans isomerase [Algoriphagus boseongensis]|nr:peptidyl-prolyl cis-trans isomerase [Algoriphagus boseongensis]
MKKLLKEPLIHFLILGCLIFAYSSWKNKAEESDNVILIDQEEYDYLLSTWKKQWNREPNTDEIEAFLDQYLRQEVFYKEALEMNLDHNDLIIKRRLAQKMEAVSNDLSAMIAPATEDELRAFYNENKKLFSLEPSFSFRQVLFLENETSQLHASLKNFNEKTAFPGQLVNRLSISNSWENAFLNEIDNAFGGDFAKSIESLPLNQWVGPISSGFGNHLVFISKKNPERIAEFEEVKALIQKEFEFRTELETQEKVYQELLKKYEIKITTKSIPQEIINRLAS